MVQIALPPLKAQIRKLPWLKQWYQLLSEIGTLVMFDLQLPKEYDARANEIVQRLNRKLVPLQFKPWYSFDTSGQHSVTVQKRKPSANKDLRSTASQLCGNFVMWKHVYGPLGTTINADSDSFSKSIWAYMEIRNCKPHIARLIGALVDSHTGQTVHLQDQGPQWKSYFEEAGGANRYEAK